jgi:hypothetical protein
MDQNMAMKLTLLNQDLIVDGIRCRVYGSQRKLQTHSIIFQERFYQIHCEMVV